MKIFRFLAVALVAMIGFNSCSKDCGHDFVERDYSNDIVGTWTCLKEGFAEALVFKADGTFSSVGVAGGEYWDYPEATWSLKNNKLALSSGDYKSNVVLEIIPGNCLALVDEKGTRNVFTYCANDLSDEVVGMWVSNDTPNAQKNDIAIISYFENGTSIFTGMIPNAESYMVTANSSYKVVGDLLFQKNAEENSTLYLAKRLGYTPNGTTFGDILTQKMYAKVENTRVETTMTYLRIKQSLDLANQKYDYIKTFVTNVSGEDKDIPFLNTSFNFAKMDGSIIDKFLKSILFTVEFPNANTINYNFLLEGQNMPMTAPIEVEGNKLTIKMSAVDAVYHDVVVYTFQDKDNSQMHMYMPTSSFEKFFANTSVAVMLGYGQIDRNDTEAIAGVYKNVADAVHSINLSLVMSKTK